MGVFDDQCIICAGPLKNYFTKNRNINYNNNNYCIIHTKKEYNWMNDLYIISQNDKLNELEELNYNPNHMFVLEGDQDIPSIICHQDCYFFLEYNFDYKLLYSDVYELLDDNKRLLKKISSYGEIKKYIDNPFDAYAAHVENDWLLKSPLINKNNSKRLLKTWKPIIKKIKQNKIIPSPIISIIPIIPREKAEKTKNNNVIKNSIRKLSRKRKTNDHDKIIQ